MEKIRLIFEGDADSPDLIFVEAENVHGNSINIGRWIEEDDYFVLEITEQDFKDKS